ncbi:MAG: response regulator [Planctomycetota bacterium]
MNGTGSGTEAAGLQVLLVDDQPIIAAGVRKLLEGEADIQLHYCQYPREAFRMAHDVNATLILQDLTMPEIDGITLVRFFRNHPATRNLPIIILSGKDTPRDKVDSFRAGANDYLVKLPEKTEFVARIRTHAGAYARATDTAGALQRLQEQVDDLTRRVAALQDENDHLRSVAGLTHGGQNG